MSDIFDLAGITKGVRPMSKAAVTRIFAGALVAVVVGSVLGLGAWVTGIAGGAVTIGGPQLVTVNAGSFAGTLLWLVIAWALVGIGALAAIASWIAALLNTAQLEDKTWFVALLVLGLFSFGWVAMIAYVVRGPDGLRGGTGASTVTA